MNLHKINDRARQEVAAAARRRFVALGLSEDLQPDQCYTFRRWAVHCKPTSVDGYTELSIWGPAGSLVGRVFVAPDGHNGYFDLKDRGMVGLKSTEIIPGRRPPRRRARRPLPMSIGRPTSGIDSLGYEGLLP